MAGDIANKGGLIGFLTTIPGILTACAGLLAPAAAIYLNSSPTPQDPREPLPPLIVNITPGTLPNDTITSYEQVDFTSVPTGGSSGDVQLMIDGCAQGDPTSCAGLLDLLSRECYEGFVLSCDVLYLVSPVGSDYETYGATCGTRLGAEYAGTCSEL